MPDERYLHGDVECLVRDVAVAAGVPASDAHVLADALVAADLDGTSTHGVSRFPVYVRRIKRGVINPTANLRIEHERPGVLTFDADNGLGQVQAVKALDLLELRAKRTGVATATIRRSHHFGALSYYCNRMAARNMILIAMTNCEPAMAPAGSSQAYFGTNPIAVSFPTGKGYPIKIDLATSIVARGNIIAAQQQGKPIPAGWALTPDGEPTTDAAAALAGTVLTMAGAKGYALALIVEILAGVLSGSAVGKSIGSLYKDSHRSQDVGHFFVLLDIGAFMDVAAFKARIDRTIDEIKACRKRPGVDEILVPGERSRRAREEHLRHGIPLAAATRTELEHVCAEFNQPLNLRPIANGRASVPCVQKS